MYKMRTDMENILKTGVQTPLKDCDFFFLFLIFKIVVLIYSEIISL